MNQPASTEPAVLLECSGGLARVTLNRPPLNILDLETIAALDAAFARLEGVSGLRAIVLAANGRAFSAGVSIQDHLADRVDKMLASFHGVFRRLRRLNCPMIAAVQGPALGGGCELAIVADWVIATANARFGFPEIRLAALPPVATVHLSRRVGPTRALQLILSGEELVAEEARAIGLADRVVSPEELAGALQGVVDMLHAKSASALRLAKRAFEEAMTLPFAEALARTERLYAEELMATRDATEGIKSFLEQRPPRWRDE